MRRSTFTVLVLLVTTTVGSCRSSKGSSAAGDTAAANARAGSLEGETKSDSDSGMAGMPGMASAGSSMMDSMRTHMRMMQSATPEQMKSMLPSHRQTVANMLSQMNAEMRSMNMPADPAWNATVDSIRQDLIHMPDMSGKELEGMMPAHGARVMRLLDMHERMLANGRKR